MLYADFVILSQFSINYHPNEKDGRQKRPSFLSFRRPLGNTDGQQDLFFRVFPAQLGIHTGAADEAEPAVHAVEEQPHVLNDVCAAALGRCDAILLQQCFDILFGTLYVVAPAGNRFRCRELLLLIIQTQQSGQIRFTQLIAEDNYRWLHISYVPSNLCCQVIE